MPPTATDPPVTGEGVAKALLDRVNAMATGMKEVSETVKTLKEKHDELKDLDIKETVSQFEKLRANVEKMQETIRLSKGGLWVPGLEDAGKKFNLLRLIKGVKYKKPEEIAPFEMEVVKAAVKQLEDHMGPAIKAGHVTWDDVAGGVWVPDQVIADVIGPIYTQSVLIALDQSEGDQTRVSVLDGLTGSPVKIPSFEGGCIAYWTGEEDDYTESQTRSGNVTLTPKKLGVLTRITAEMMNMASPGFDAFMRRDMIRAAAKKVDYTILYGTGSDNMPLGMVEHSQITQFYASGKSTTDPADNGAELDFDGLDEMLGVLEDNDVNVDASWAWVFHPRYKRRLRQIKVLNFSGQDTNQPYLLGSPMIPDQRIRDLIGNFATTTQIPTTNTKNSSGAKLTDVFGGNWSEMVFGRWGGLQILDDGGTGEGFIRDQTYVKLRMWCDNVARQTKAFLYARDVIARD